MPPHTASADNLALRDSEMARRLRAFDWSSTPLGPIASWPACLRIAVGICLNSRFPMFVWWGPELINIYNDAYIPVLGKRHPAAFGRPAQPTWQDIWGVVGPQAETVLRTGQATWNERVLLVMERHGYTEDTWFTWSYSPIPDEAGGIGGMFCACTEDTPRVLAERERDRLDAALRESEWRFRQMADAAPAILWVTDPEGCCTFLSRSWFEYTGQSEEAALGLGWLDAIHPDDFERTREAFVASNARRAEFRIDYRVRRADGQYRWALDIGRPRFAADGEYLGYVGSVIDVHDRRRSEDALLRERRLYEAVLNNTPDLAYVFDLDHRFVYANDVLLRMWGKSWDEAIGKNCLELGYEPWHAAMHDREIERVVATRKPIRGEVPFAGTFGRRIYDYIFVPVLGPDGRVEAVAGTTRDVTELKAAEARDKFLLRLDDAVRGLTDPDAVTLTAATMLGEHLNADRCAYADVEPDEDTMNLTGNYVRHPGIRSIVGRLRFADFGAEVLRLMRDNKPFVVEDVDTHRPPVGDPEAYRAAQVRSVICVPLHKEGKFVAAMAVHCAAPRAWKPEEVDLLQHVANRCWESIVLARVQRTLRESERHLRRQVAEFQTLLDVIPVGIAVAMDRRCRTIRVNDAFARVLGISPDANASKTAPPGERPTNFRCLDARGEEVPDDRLPMQVSAREGVAVQGVELDIVHADGRVVRLLEYAAPLFDERGEPRGSVGAFVDVTEQRRAQELRQELLESERTAREEAERVNRMKDEFLATLSHELRTPLNAILGWAQVLNRGRHDPKDLASGLAAIERNARAQTQLIADLLDMSRIISGKVRLDVQRVDVAEVIRAAAETVQAAADARGVRLTLALDPRAGPINGDPGRLQQVFWNLLSNAIKFTPRGGRVQVVAERVHSCVEVSVADTGEGIAPEFLPLVFERFRQADASTTRRHGGLGLGLAIVKHLVELHGGTVRAVSPGPGQGATFLVSLPVSAVHPGAVEDPERRHPEAGGVPMMPNACELIAGVRVLVIDDEEDSRLVVRRLLEECNAAVTTAGSAAEAMERLAETRPDVLVSDIGMPGEDGYALIRKVRALGPDRGGTVPAIALTAYARAEDRTRSILAGYQMHVSKPVEPAELIAMIASLAGRGGRA